VSNANNLAQLCLYNERAAELNESSFLRQSRDGLGTTFTLLGGPFRVVRVGGPEHEAMKAFLLTFRLFLQDRDELSFRKIDERYAEMPVEGGLKMEVAGVRRHVNTYLDQRSPFVIRGEQITRRQLLNVWLNGELAHVNPDKRAILDRWGVAEDLRPLYQFEFEVIVTQLTQAVFWIRQVNLCAIAELMAAATHSQTAI
jgi:hypothetical protein